MRDRLKDEHGAIAVLAALTIVILLAAVAFVIDISRLYHERQVLQNAVDFGSLAGAQNLPVQGSAQANIASAIARTVAIANAPQVATAGLTITYQCVVGDHDGDGLPDPGGHPVRLRPDGDLDRRDGHEGRGGRSMSVTRSRATSATRSGCDQQLDPVLLRAGDRDQHRLDRGGERRVLQGCVRRGLESPRRRDGPRPDGKHDATPTSTT